MELSGYSYNNIFFHFGTYFKLIIVPIICEMNEISVQVFNSFNKTRKLEALIFIIQVDSCYEIVSEKNLKHLSTYWLSYGYDISSSFLSILVFTKSYD